MGIVGRLPVLALLFSLCAVAADVIAGETDAAGPPIALTNYTGGETLRYPVPLIRGVLADTTLTTVEVVNESSSRDTARLTCQAYQGRFKALTELVPGENRIVISAGGDQLAVNLNYAPQTNPHVVRVVYATDSTGDTAYQTPFEDDPQNYADKLGVMMMLMQTFTAERMHDLDLGRRTFNLELDERGKVEVHLLRCDKTAQEIYDMGGGRVALYGYLHGQLKRQMPNAKAKNIVIPAFSRFVPETKRNVAYTALGGGNLALFGGSNLYCYPGSLADVQRAFSDTTRIDTARYSSDSAGRHTHWANASTSIGATLHELGHTFGLPHQGDRWAIMQRGFDFFNRFWTVVEPPPRDGRPPLPIDEARSARWSPDSASQLKGAPWFALEAAP